ncbi:hypothetical protein [Acidovorax sp.]|uniref:hypothetical protein n=1 Tax=Acidovorax sp. TaxID=1872122 RepID=UPI002ACEC8CA|nr:hypothetical protein [Acidovorax sp.]MDZ7863965.1 hypothetical protein [Acidovorax sp.]
MSKNILLARPHPFIVAEMKPFLEENGYTLAKLEVISNMATLAPKAGGAVISMALSSSIPESAEEVFQQLRQSAPAVPVVFASMLSLDMARPGLERMAALCRVNASIAGIDNEGTVSQWGRPDTFLYFSKDDLAIPARRAIAARILKRHFTQ